MRKNSALVFLFFLFLTAPFALQAQSFFLSSEDKEAREVIELLKSRYVDPSAINDKSITGANLNEFLNSLHGGATILAQPTQTNSFPPITAELLPHKIAYWRLASFKPATDWVTLQNQLLDWIKDGAIGIILDVRNFDAINDYAGAAQAASYFSNPGVTFFSVQGLKIPQQVYRNALPQRFFPRPVIIVMNRRTVGAAEALAATLKATSGAILIGQTSAGQAALFNEVPLSSGRFLQLAVGRVTLGDGTQLFGKPLTPDIDLFVDEAKEKAALDLEIKSGVTPLVQELPSRGHLSEAALVKDETPELDEALNDQLHGKENGDQPVVRDSLIVHAMDVLRAIDLVNSTPAMQGYFEDIPK